MKLDSWEKEPLWLKVLTPYLRKKRLPELKGEPEVNQWVRIPLEGCVAANEEKTYADFKLGSENKLLIFFMGGGGSWNEYTAAHPASLYSKDIQNGFYTIHMDLFTDLRLNSGVFAERKDNPFWNWSKLFLIYDTGDFHVGTNDFPYTAQDGSERICHHHGYINYRKAMEKEGKHPIIGCEVYMETPGNTPRRVLNIEAGEENIDDTMFNNEKAPVSTLAGEHLILLLLNHRLALQREVHCTIGTADTTLVPSREILSTALREGAAGFILLHNHPSGDPTPSQADIAVTQELDRASRLVHVMFHDHIIIGDTYISLRQMGYLGTGQEETGTER